MKKETLVKNPKKTHECYLCKEKIAGEHIKVFAVTGKEHSHWRAHLGCYKQAQKMCADCAYNGDCYYDVFECYYNDVLRKESLQEKKEKNNGSLQCDKPTCRANTGLVNSSFCRSCQRKIDDYEKREKDEND